jgi:hypothetical protein
VSPKSEVSMSAMEHTEGFMEEAKEEQIKKEHGT